MLVSKRDLEGINDSISFQLNYEQRSEDNMDIARYKSKYGDLGHMEDMLNAKFTVKFSVSKDENNFFNFMNSYNSKKYSYRK